MKNKHIVSITLTEGDEIKLEGIRGRVNKIVCRMPNTHPEARLEAIYITLFLEQKPDLSGD
jgi:hypothetical protein